MTSWWRRSCECLKSLCFIKVNVFATLSVYSLLPPCMCPSLPSCISVFHVTAMHAWIQAPCVCDWRRYSIQYKIYYCYNIWKCFDYFTISLETSTNCSHRFSDLALCHQCAKGMAYNFLVFDSFLFLLCFSSLESVSAMHLFSEYKKNGLNLFFNLDFIEITSTQLLRTPVTQTFKVLFFYFCQKRWHTIEIQLGKDFGLSGVRLKHSWRSTVSVAVLHISNAEWVTSSGRKEGKCSNA